jgi:hypothetical protein
LAKKTNKNFCVRLFFGIGEEFKQQFLFSLCLGAFVAKFGGWEGVDSKNTYNIITAKEAK